jgi:hypothetical protein
VGGTQQGGTARSAVALDLRKKEVMKFLLEKNTLKEISVLTGYSYQSIRNYVSDPWFQNELKAYSEETWQYVLKEVGEKQAAIAERVNLISQKALDRMEAIIRDGTDNIAFKAAQDILDRNPEIPRNKRFEGEVTQKVVDPAALIHAAAVARELERMGPRFDSPSSSATVIEAEQPGQS